MTYGKKEKPAFSKEYFAKDQTQTAERFDFLYTFTITKFCCMATYVGLLWGTEWHYAPIELPFVDTAAFGYVMIKCQSDLSAQIDAMGTGPTKMFAQLMSGKDPANIEGFSHGRMINPFSIVELQEFICSLIIQLPIAKGGSLLGLLQDLQAWDAIPFMSAMFGDYMKRDCYILMAAGGVYILGVFLNFLFILIGVVMLRIYWMSRPSPAMRECGTRLVALGAPIMLAAYLAYSFMPPKSFDLAEKYATMMTGGSFGAFLTKPLEHISMVYGDLWKHWMYCGTAILADLFMSTWFLYSFPIHPKERRDEKKRGSDEQMEQMEMNRDIVSDMEHDQEEYDNADDPMAEFADLEGDFGHARDKY